MYNISLSGFGACRLHTCAASPQAGGNFCTKIPSLQMIDTMLSFLHFESEISWRCSLEILHSMEYLTVANQKAGWTCRPYLLQKIL